MTQPTAQRAGKAFDGASAMWVLAPCALLYGVFIARTGFLLDGVVAFGLFDDAMISMVYARNIAEGLGPVWSSVPPAVEGISNPLWTLWMSLLHGLPIGMEKVSLAVMLSGGLLLLWTVWLHGLLHRELAPAPHGVLAAVVGAALVGLHFPLVFWSLRGMEVSVGAALISYCMVACWRVTSGKSNAGAGLLVVLALLPALRMDLALPAAIVVLHLALRGRVRLAVCGAGSIASSFIVLFWVRWHFYGELFPNTYWLKVSGTTAVERWSRGGTSLGFALGESLVLLLLLAAVGLWRASPDVRRFLRLPSGLFVGQAAYAVYVGGDAWDWLPVGSRFLTMAIVPLFVPAVVGAVWLLRTSRRSVVVLLAVAAIPGLLCTVSNDVAIGWFTGWTSPAGIVSLLCLGAVWQRRREDRMAKDSVQARGADFGPRPSILMVCVLTISLSGRGWGLWVRENALHVEEEVALARVGRAVRDLTDPDQRIAVTWAGTLGYFTGRDVVDFLGKCDPVIARSEPRVSFHPGHSKWDVRSSVQRLHPSLILQEPSLSPEEQAFLRGLYVRLPNGIRVARGSDLDAAAFRSLPAFSFSRGTRHWFER